MNFSLLLFSLLLAADGRLSVKDAKLLVENTPEFLKAAREKRCPEVEVLWSGEEDVAFQMRSRCTDSPSGLIGNYFVDRKTAEVWIGVDRDHLVQSKRLRELQRVLLKRLGSGHVRKK